MWCVCDVINEYYYSVVKAVGLVIEIEIITLKDDLIAIFLVRVLDGRSTM